MRIYTTFKPTRVESSTKCEVTTKIMRGRHFVSVTWSSTSCGAWAKIGGSGAGDPDYVIGINYEKRRNRKTKGGEKIRETHWIAHYYIFYVDFLKASGLRVVQNSRNFRLEKVKM